MGLVGVAVGGGHVGEGERAACRAPGDVAAGAVEAGHPGCDLWSDAELGPEPAAEVVAAPPDVLGDGPDARGSRRRQDLPRVPHLVDRSADDVVAAVQEAQQDVVERGEAGVPPGVIGVGDSSRELPAGGAEDVGRLDGDRG